MVTEAERLALLLYNLARKHNVEVKLRGKYLAIHIDWCLTPVEQIETEKILPKGCK